MQLRTIEVVGSVPLEMFERVRETASNIGKGVTYDIDFRLQPDGVVIGSDAAVAESINPLVGLIQARAMKRIRFIRFTISSDLILPGCIPQGRSGNTHRDGRTLDRVDRYVTADGFFTQFSDSDLVPDPGDVIHYKRVSHRAPKNETGKPISRTWIRGDVYPLISRRRNVYP